MSTKDAKNTKTACNEKLGGNVAGGQNRGAYASKRTHLTSEHFSDQPENKKAADLLSAAGLWIEDNAGIWDEWRAEVARRVSVGRSWGMQELAEAYRRTGRVNAIGGDFILNNNLCPVLARLICEFVPGAEKLTDLRNSVFERAYRERMEEERLNG